MGEDDLGSGDDRPAGAMAEGTEGRGSGAEDNGQDIQDSSAGDDEDLNGSRPISLMLMASPSEDLTEKLKTVREETTPLDERKHSTTQYLRLSRDILCQNYGKWLFQFANMMKAAMLSGHRQGWPGFFYDLSPARTNVCRALFASSNDHRLKVADNKVTIVYPDDVFDLTYGQMADCAILWDFLTGILDFKALEAVLAPLQAESATTATASAVAKEISRQLFGYLKDNLISLHAQRRFRQMIEFVSHSKGKSFGPDDIDDDDVFSYWRMASVSESEARREVMYRNVFISFTRLIDLLNDGEVAKRFSKMSSAIPLDREEPWLEFASDEDDLLAQFDEEPISRVNYLFNNERRDLELPACHRRGIAQLLHSFVRAETFGRHQSSISQGRRDRADPAGLRQRIRALPERDYDGHVGRLQELDDHLLRLALAALHMLEAERDANAGGGVRQADFNLRQKTRDAFNSIGRAGFRRADRGDPHVLEAHAHVGTLIAGLRKRLEGTLRLLQAEAPWAERFETDRGAFADQFSTIYGVR